MATIKGFFKYANKKFQYESTSPNIMVYDDYKNLVVWGPIKLKPASDDARDILKAHQLNL